MVGVYTKRKTTAVDGQRDNPQGASVYLKEGAVVTQSPTPNYTVAGYLSRKSAIMLD